MKFSKVVIVGIAGRMGVNLYQHLSRQESIQIVGGVESEKSPHHGKSFNVLAREQSIPGINSSLDTFSIVSDLDQVEQSYDVVVDFSAPVATMKHLEATADLVGQGRKIAWVIGTTGFSEEELKQVERYARRFPIVKSGNFSTGINVLLKLVRMGIVALGEGYDIEIMESHHREKVDAPSGTANMIRDEVLQVKDLGMEAVVHGRNGIVGRREKDQVGISVLRGGGVIGEHELLCLGDDEVLKISHSALNRKAFTGGVIRAVNFLQEVLDNSSDLTGSTDFRQTGIFDMQSVLGLEDK